MHTITRSKHWAMKHLNDPQVECIREQLFAGGIEDTLQEEARPLSDTWLWWGWGGEGRGITESTRLPSVAYRRVLQYDILRRAAICRRQFHSRAAFD